MILLILMNFNCKQRLISLLVKKKSTEILHQHTTKDRFSLSFFFHVLFFSHGKTERFRVWELQHKSVDRLNLSSIKLLLESNRILVKVESPYLLNSKNSRFFRVLYSLNIKEPGIFLWHAEEFCNTSSLASTSLSYPQRYFSPSFIYFLIRSLTLLFGRQW